MPDVNPVSAITVEQADATTLTADVLVLRYAQALFGLDRAVAVRLGLGEDDLPPPGRARLFSAGTTLGAHRVLVLGTRPATRFDYEDVRDFGFRAAFSSGATREGAGHIALTVPGPGFGLDEGECFRALVAGLAEALPGSGVERVTVAEADARRAAHFADILRELLPVTRSGAAETAPAAPSAALDQVGARSREKPFVFVAMPFAAELDDHFHYGIQGAVNAAGYLCERADLAAFTGDVMDWVKERIAKADLVVAELTGRNANVFLEVGYAWGRGIPTVLLARDTAELPFDVQGQRCLLYRSIRHLEELLRAELSRLPVGRGA